jgi:hypothetical protein
MSQNLHGYRDLSAEDKALINIIKGKADEVDSLIGALEIRPATLSRRVGEAEKDRAVPADGSVDPRQLALARTQLEDGFMHLVRAIAQPRSF